MELDSALEEWMKDEQDKDNFLFWKDMFEDLNAQEQEGQGQASPAAITAAEYNLPYQPVDHDHGVPVFNSEQLKVYGVPDNYGCFDYIVIELSETVSPYVTDWDMDQERYGSLRPIHHYNRVKRFESVIYQLLSARGEVPDEVILFVKLHGYNTDKDLIWDEIRNILKMQGWRRYYNRIPTILSRLGFPLKINYGNRTDTIDLIIREFRRISMNFETMFPVEGKKRKKYFPNIRFVALKLLEHYDTEFEYNIPFVRTPRKVKSMHDMWDLLFY